eukprot:TRINITY_DN29001_c0_g1_i1.p1 TRINITY_DN29001_c0_g1~~TRINITY_DN29001_c0_g1_i1.p1  ORF type:complete len:452 (-),score=83.51 TRINITY_DN29001_c0_g1_i1:17-1372(-)
MVLNALCFFELLRALATVKSADVSTGDVDAVVHYGVVFDAGSSGSRVHVYSWRRSGLSGDFDLIDDDLVKSKPGLSAFVGEPEAAGSSLDALLAHAESKVPPERRRVTPVFLMATAGLRIAGDEAAKAVLDNVAVRLSASPFMFRPEWAYIMPGSEEAVFGWVAVNYLLGSLGGKRATTGVIDLGGGSVQIVYEPSLDDGVVLPDAYRGEVNFAGRRHQLYQKSHLDFGLDRVRERAVAELMQRHGSQDARAHAVQHACLPADHTATLSVAPAARGSPRQQVPFVGTGSYAVCEKLLRKLFAKDARCEAPPCSFNGVFQPALPASLFGFSYLFDRTRAIGLLDGKVEEYGVQNMTVNDIRQAAIELCSSPPDVTQIRFEGCQDGARWVEFCGDVTYLAVLLEHGLGVDPAASLTMGNKVGGVEIVWTLGAIIARAEIAEKASATARTSDEL